MCVNTYTLTWLEKFVVFMEKYLYKYVSYNEQIFIRKWYITYIYIEYFNYSVFNIAGSTLILNADNIYAYILKIQ